MEYVGAFLDSTSIDDTFLGDISINTALIYCTSIDTGETVFVDRKSINTNNDDLVDGEWSTILFL